MQHDEDVVVVLIELGTFDGAADVFEVERVDVGEAGAQGIDVRRAGLDEVEPGQVAVLDDASSHGVI